jgi:hypothetical protein
VAGGTATAPTAGEWLRDAARLAGRGQRLLVFPLALAIVVYAAAVPAAIAAGADTSFSALARYVVDVDGRLVDALDGTVEPGTAEWVLLAANVVLQGLAGAWLIGAFVRSLVEGRVVRFPGLATFVRLAVFYIGFSALLAPIIALAGGGGGWDLVALLVPVVLFVATMFTDLVIVIDDAPIRRGLLDSARVVRTRPGLALLAFVLSYSLWALAVFLFDDAIEDAEEVFPPFLVAAALAHGVVLYVTNCALIALLRGVREHAVDD